MSNDPKDKPSVDEDVPQTASQKAGVSKDIPEEEGGPEGPEPTRYGDWERKGRCFDF